LKFKIKKKLPLPSGGSGRVTFPLVDGGGVGEGGAG
jgi:hypothetical protein